MINIHFRKGNNRIPILSKQEIDVFAEAILSDFKPELLTVPGATPIDEFAKSYLKLTLEFASLSRDDSICGVIAYNDGTVDLYDEIRQPKQAQVREGTVFINSNLLNDNQSTLFRFALGHETGHWIFHKHKYLRDKDQEVNQPAAVSYKCRKKDVGSISRFTKFQTDDEWMEWQADYFSSALLMPKPAILTCIGEGLNNSGLSIKEIYECGDKVFIAIQSLVDDVSRVFNVSPQAAAIRLYKLGYMTQDYLSWILDEAQAV